MIKKRKAVTYYEHARSKGISRRDFLKFASLAAASIGLSYSAVGQVVEALETKQRIPVIWQHFQECTGCTESFVRSAHPLLADILLDHISLDYTETLFAASGHQAEAARAESIKENYGKYILIVEGAIPMKDNGVYCTIGGRSALDILKESAEGAAAIITFGSCSSNGGIQSAHPNPTGAVPVDEIIKNKPIVKVPGCPPIGEVMAGVVVHYLTFGTLPELDNQGRPKEFYGKRIHDTCYRRPNFDAGIFVESYDDLAAKESRCLYKLGCRGPATYNACSTVEWNNGVGFPIKSGNPCIGCSEKGFWDNDSFSERLTDVDLNGIESTADTIGKVATGLVAGGVITHGILSNVAKRKEIKEGIDRGVKNYDNVED